MSVSREVAISVLLCVAVVGLAIYAILVLGPHWYLGLIAAVGLVQLFLSLP